MYNNENLNKSKITYITNLEFYLNKFRKNNY